LAIHIDPEADLPDVGLLASVAALVATAVERIHYVEVANASELETQSVRLRNSILAAISHDIRTPLTVL
jgi:two-component system sensor histidine kinase KdpD